MSLPYYAALFFAAFALFAGLVAGWNADHKNATFRACRGCSSAGAGAMVFIIGAGMISGPNQVSFLVAGITGLTVFFGGVIALTRKQRAKRWLLTSTIYGLAAAWGMVYTPSTSGMFFFMLTSYAIILCVTPIITLIVWPREVIEEETPQRHYVPIGSHQS